MTKQRNVDNESDQCDSSQESGDTFLINRPTPGTKGDISTDIDRDNVEITYENPTISDDEYRSLIKNMNAGQKKIFDMIHEHCQGVKKI